MLLIGWLWEREVNPDDLCGLGVITKVFVSERQPISQKYEDAALLALKMDNGTKSQE